MRIAITIIFLILSAPSFSIGQCLNTPEFPFTTDEDDYSWSGNIYPQSEVGGAVSINSVSFYLDNPVTFNGTYSNFEIYLRHTTDTQYPSFGKAWSAMGLGLGDRYYSGPLALTSGQGLYTLPLSSSFAYNGTNNLEVVFACVGGDANAYTFPQEPWFRRTAGYPNYPGNIAYDNSYPFSFEFKSRRQFKLLLVINGNQQLGVSGGAACDIVLPVELIDFSAEYDQQRGTTQLSWTTASEINHHYFEIQRSYDGQDFEGIGQVMGAGTTTEEQDYSFEDHGVDDAKGTSAFYRLKQVDFDGAMYLSETRSVVLGKASDRINAYIDGNTLNLSFATSASGEIFLTNSIGQIVRTSTINDADELQMDASSIPEGIYFVTLRNRNGVQNTVKVYRN